MSSITDMVIFTEIGDEEAMARLNAWCVEHDTERHQKFERLDAHPAGGWKVFTPQVWAMAGNYFPWWELAEALPTFGWLTPATVVLVCQYHGDGVARVFRADGQRIDA